jgi:hypothetical protein
MTLNTYAETHNFKIATSTKRTLQALDELDELICNTNALDLGLEEIANISIALNTYRTLIADTVATCDGVR